jgi:SAM-dependent methyltransferase
MVSTDMCVGFFTACWEKGLVTFPTGARVLEIGCAEGDWVGPMLQCRPDLQIVGIDVRPIDRPGAAVIQGDILTQTFEPESFDAVVAISSLEHIGLGWYGDPVDPEGDCRAVRRVAEWLKPGGLFYFDVPYRPSGPYTVTKSFRAYDRAALEQRLLTAAPRLRAETAAQMDASHPDGPYIACTLRKVA